MTRKDYFLIASVFHNGYEQVSMTGTDDDAIFLNSMADHMGDLLAEDNPRFDRTKFLKACGYRPEAEGL